MVIKVVMFIIFLFGMISEKQPCFFQVPKLVIANKVANLQHRKFPSTNQGSKDSVKFQIEKTLQ